MNRLYYGDNLNVLRDQIADESIDLIYLDPPFNSKSDYNVLFRTPLSSEAQITAFKDTWRWSEQAEREYSEILRHPNTNTVEIIRALRMFMRETDMMAYLTTMTRRLLEMHRVLKLTGSLYLHCDPTASHYLKIILDSMFAPKGRFISEIIWKRTSAHNSARRPGPIHDVILYYAKSNKDYVWNPERTPYDAAYVESNFRHVEPETGRRFTLGDLTGAGVRKGETGQIWRGIDVTAKKRHWMRPPAELDILAANGLIVFPEGGGMPRFKRYLDEATGMQIQDVWDDIAPLGAHAKERLGYPTQKPLALLERIITLSTYPGAVVLDPFCGCGTAIHAAHKLGRNWIGIDITSLAITLIEGRMRSAFPDVIFTVEGFPKDFDSAADLARRDKYQFQYWACSLVKAQPYQNRRKGADGGIDGIIAFEDVVNGKRVDQMIVVSVKGGESVSVSMIRELITVIEQNRAAIGLFVCLAEPTQPMIREAAAAGFYNAGNGLSYPRVQILTINDLLMGQKRPEYFGTSQQQTFKQAQREKSTSVGQLDLL